MAKENERKSRDKKFRDTKRKRKSEQVDKTKSWHGPRLPNVLQKEINLLNNGVEDHRSGDEGTYSDDVFENDLYEYEEATAEEESKKNKRFDSVENYDFELPEKFEDYKVSSDESGDDEEYSEDDPDKQKDDSMQMGNSDGIIGVRKKKDFIVSESYPECEYNPTSDVLDGAGKISIKDLEDLLHGTPGFSKLRKGLHMTEKISMPTLAPLPKTEKDRVERIASYEQSKKDITKWEPLVKRNREAPTLYFDQDVDTDFSSIGAIASRFEPRTDFEKNIASLVRKKEIVDAHLNDGTTLLEMNKIPLENLKDREARLAKMRSFLFHHELKAKRIKKIKSKTYHRMLKKDRRKAAEAATEMDPEAAKKQARDQEFKRAQERMTLKHKNSSKWAKRILHRGLNVQDEATREAFGEQLNQHAALTRKINTLKESSSDDSSDDDSSAMSDQDDQSKLLNNAKEKTLKLLQGDEELPKSGVLSLPFMVRGLQKKKEAADQEAKLVLEQFESSLQKLEENSLSGDTEKLSSSGRRAFGAPKQVMKKTKRDDLKLDNYYGDSDSENDRALENEPVQHFQNDQSVRDLEIDPNILREEFDISHSPVPESFEGSKDPEPKETYEVAYLASDSWKKVARSSVDVKQIESYATEEPDKDASNIKDDDDSDTDSAGEMVDGILSSGAKLTNYELPSQAELIQRAFAGDDVVQEFKIEKEAVLNEENPEPEKPVLIPGWGQWTDIQKKKGLPNWMLQEHELAKEKRLESVNKRKDARLGNVIISEKVDKKGEKLMTKTLPFPFTSKEVFEQSVRMPIGPEFNPATAVAPLIRPEVVKRPGVIIRPISYEEVNVGERTETHKHKNQKQKSNGKKNKKQKKSAKQTAV